jgi:hypothetical protein
MSQTAGFHPNPVKSSDDFDDTRVDAAAIVSEAVTGLSWRD